jgi:hypothetical protein
VYPAFVRHDSELPKLVERIWHSLPTLPQTGEANVKSKAPLALIFASGRLILAPPMRAAALCFAPFSLRSAPPLWLPLLRARWNGE